LPLKGSGMLDLQIMSQMFGNPFALQKHK